jgi:hypothetical protein
MVNQETGLLYVKDVFVIEVNILFVKDFNNK